MVRTVCRTACGVVCIAVAVGWLASPSEAQPLNPIVQLARKLARPIDFPGTREELPLGEVLELLTTQTGVHFDIDQRAFVSPEIGGAALHNETSPGDRFLIAAQDKPGGKAPEGAKPQPKGPPPGKGPPPPPPEGGMGNILNAPVRPVPKMTGVRLETVVKRILARVPANLDYVLRRDGVEITTPRAKQGEFYQFAARPVPDPELPPELDRLRLAPLVQAEFTKEPLDDALRQLADATDYTILLDPRVEEKARAVTATLVNVPLDTAVDLLANLSGLQVVRRDRALYVTTSDNRVAMEKELRERVPPLPNTTFPAVGGPGPMPPGGVAR